MANRSAKRAGAEQAAPAGVTVAAVAALSGAPAPQAEQVPGPGRILLSEGVKQDLIRLGRVTDPGTGHELRLDAVTGSVTAWHRGTGEQLDIPVG